MPRIPRPAVARRAFTIMELMIVVGIIGLLVGITLMVGSTVMASGKSRLTQDILRTLNAAMDDYIAVKGEAPPGVYVAGTGPMAQRFPIADAYNVSGTGPHEQHMLNTVGMFMEMARKVGSTSKILDSLPQSNVKLYDSDGAGPLPSMMTVFDGWGRPIRFVHPAFQGVYQATSSGELYPLQPVPPSGIIPEYAVTQIRRTNEPTGSDPADADGGQCVGNRPYFYSLGDDGLAGVRKDAGKVVTDYNKDNIYSMPPNFVDKMN